PIRFAEAFAFWVKLGFISFGGPAGQIAIMHRVMVEEKKWIDEQRFLHALNFCMLLPGPEAQKLATYVGWLLHGVRGGLAAGIFFTGLPFPRIVLAAGLVGGFIIESRAGAAAQPVPGRWRHAAISVAGGLALWWAPVAVAVLLLGSSHVLVDIGLFFSKLAV